jgi:DNA invertase Pin-like site-specific DNA recombinase
MRIEAMETAIAYIRVSTDKQARGTSLETQEDKVNEYVAQKSYRFDRLFIEEGENAKTDKRPVLQELLRYVRESKGRISVVIFPKVDRWSRYTEDYFYLKRFLREKGVRVESTDERFDDTPSGRFLESMLAATAQFDNDVRAERSKSGMREAVKSGRWVWKAPIGYRNVRIAEKATAEIDPVTGPLIREAFERLARREGTAADIRRWLATNGIQIVRSYFHRMLHNRIYIGTIDAFGEASVAVPPLLPLVSKKVFYAAQEALRPRRLPKVYQRDREDFPLRGTLRCSTCLKFMTAGWAKGRSRKYAYYRCQDCSGFNLPKVPTEGLFMRALQAEQRRYRVDERLRDRLLKYWDAKQLENVNLRKQIENDIRSLRELQKATALQNARGIIPDHIAEDQIRESEENIRSRYADLANLPLGHQPAEVIQFGERFLNNLPRNWREGNLRSRKRIQKFFYPNGATASRQRVIGTDNDTRPTDSKDSHRSELSSAVPLTDKTTNHYCSIHSDKFSIADRWQLLQKVFEEFSQQPFEDDLHRSN